MYSSIRDRVWIIGSAVIICLAIVYNIGLIQHAYTGDIREDMKDYTYIGMDHPYTFLPLSKFSYDSKMTIEETAHYSLNATEDWESLVPLGDGFVRLGPSHGYYGLSMFHQLHCLKMFGEAIVVKPSADDTVKREHLHHCLSYIRQMILCSASTRLEPVKERADGEFFIDGVGLEHKCRDWSMLWGMVEDNYRQWPSWE